ncbi:hypothetical protein DM558_09765 [Entomomonas moraniae]|uniref:Uncharacterized protein n=1 Tax=Entomomonas moraniae TaxID=2213226 RepID=A0A3Q9JJG3_9GAMM|nr:hypothetical protein [Entomomonas moraniae]AZS51043.1 hypothetical protein DM558_09765 [Entomomonas moraniae]
MADKLVFATYRCPVEAIEPCGEIKHCNALLNWFDHHCVELHSSGIIELTKETLVKLSCDLNGLSAANCTEVFPTIRNFVHGFDEYDETYWQQVYQLRQWCIVQLAETDFTAQRLFLQASW